MIFHFLKKILIVRFRWTKTIQFEERFLEIPIVKNVSSPLCAYSAFKSMCSELLVPSDSSAFVVKINKKYKQVSYSLIQNFLKYVINQVGLDPEKYSSHSFRRGGATWAFRCGVSPNLIQLQGDWQSDAYKLYLQHGLDDKLAVSF